MMMKMMIKHNNICLLLSICIIILIINLPPLAKCIHDHDPQKTYIVYFGRHSGEKTPEQILQTHHSYLTSVKQSEEEAKASLIYSYKHSINGFAASLTPQQASQLNELEEVISVIDSRPRKYKPHTTRSWEFAGLNEAAPQSNLFETKKSSAAAEDLLHKAGYGKNVIVGVLDSGIWPESQSFSDQGLEPVPKTWKGICQTGQDFNSSHCNKKIIGARYYLKGYESHYGKLNTTQDYRSARDKDGHGTHVASIAAGRQVQNASAFGGFARGTASGGAPLARLAVYKVCWPTPGQEKTMGNTCGQEDMLAAMDDAIADGVHVISISIGSDDLLTHMEDGISIGAFHALQSNIVVACSAGNSGPAPATLSNAAPWIITVGASSMDRAFLGPLVLGNGLILQGQTVTPYTLRKGLRPLISAADAALPWVPKNETEQCLPNSLSPEKVKGKIVLCIRGTTFRVLKGMEVKRAGGAGFILGNSAEFGDAVYLEPHVLPTTAVGYNDTIRIIDYIASTKGNATARLVAPQTVFGHGPAPFMAGFTSRGPNVIHPSILKPDVTAPGLNILGAWSEASSPSKVSEDHRVVSYNFDSGTSMSCPHIAGLAALVKAIHPTWSSAAIRSAIMTTASVKNKKGEAITYQSGMKATPFEFGSGHFHPSKAADPGLVFDASYDDYLLYLCSYGLKNADQKFKCPKISAPLYDLNYPSVSVPKLNGSATVKRTVTNVGGGGKVAYFFGAKPPPGLSVEARPSILYFSRVGEKKSFELRITVRNGTMAGQSFRGGYGFGWYSWKDDYHVVRSPIVVSLAA